MGSVAGEGRLISPMNAYNPDKDSLLYLDKGTRVIDREGKLVNLIRITYAEQVPELPVDTMLIGKAYQITPDGASFNNEITLTLGYNVNDLPAQIKSLVLECYNEESGWVELKAPEGMIAGVGETTATLEHFSIFAVLAKTTGPSFRVANLNVSPSKKVFWRFFPLAESGGNEVTISFDASNTGGQRGVHTVVLKIDGKTVEEKYLILDPFQNEQVTFTLTGIEKGRHLVEVEDLSAKFTTSFTIKWWLFGIIIVVLAVAGLLIWKFAFH
jgi:hypothetical protein